MEANINEDVFESESIFDFIIRSAESGEMTTRLPAEWYSYTQTPSNRTLNMEHQELIATNFE